MARTGRPREFDRDAAVVNAMHLFWEHGFEGASLDRLRAAMGGISSASFYAAFRSKEALYRETIEQYLRTHGQVMSALRDPSLPPRQQVEQALRRSAVMQTSSAHPTGCMVALSALIGSRDADVVREITSAERSMNRLAIRDCVEAAIAGGALTPETDSAGLSTLIDGLLVGLSIQARDNVDVESLDGSIDQVLKAWDANANDAVLRA